MRERSRTQKLLNRACDAVVEAVNPAAAARRQVVRNRSDRFVELASAQHSRFTPNWEGARHDANSQTLPDLPEVRRRSRDAAVNNPIYIAVRETMVQHVVGARGIQPRSSIDHARLGITEQQASEWQDAVNLFWEDASKHADVTGKQEGWGNFLRLVYRSMFDGGDVFPTFPLRTWRGIGRMTRVNLIEAERVGTPPAKISDPRVDGGVQTDAWGAPIGYYVTRAHPGDRKAGKRAFQFEYWSKQRADRINILQLMQQERVGQSRGLPKLASVLGLMDQVDQYEDSSLVAAEMQTRFALFVRTQGDADDYASEYERDSGRYGDLFDDGIEPGSIHVLNEGDTIETAGATHPSSYFDPFVMRLLRTISSVTKVPYSIAFGDTQGANYSSMRREFQSFRHTVSCEQELLMPLCRTYWNQLLYEAWLDGQILPDADWVDFRERPELWASALWSMPVLGNVDPTKETKSDIDAITAGITSPQEVIRGRGQDPEKVVRERREWRELEERNDLTSSAPEPQPEDDEPAQPEIDENTELPPQFQQEGDE